VAVDAEIIPVTANPIVSDITRCGPGAVTINAIDTAVVNWFNDPVNGAHIYSGNVFVTGYIPHDTTFYVEAGTFCVSERLAVNVTINSSPPPLVNTASRCGPGQLVLTASSLAPVFWYDSVVAGNQVGSGVNFLTPSLTETKKYYVESNNGCASARVQAIAMVHTVPDPPVGFDSSACGNGSVSIYATSAVQIFWYSTPTGGTSLGSGSLFNTPVISTNTTYYAESFDICSSTRTPVQAIIMPVPASPVGNDASICGVGQAYLSASATDPIYWFAQPTGSQVLGTGNTFMTPVLSSTTTFFAVAITDCPSIPEPVTATVIVVPQVSLGNDTTIQSGSSFILDAGPGYDSYLWSTGATTQTISVSNTGVFYVEALLDGCSSTDTINLTVILGIQDNSTFDGTIHVFPNPVKENLTIQLETQKFTKAEISIRELTGKELYRRKLSIINGFSSESIEMNSFATGIYLVTILSDDFTKTISIVVE
jgi:Ig-like domain CHU_C associated/Secretion system C-terminal sorting domain